MPPTDYYQPQPLALAPIGILQSSAMIGSIIASATPPVLATLVAGGLLDTETAASIGGVVTSLAGLLAVRGRLNGGRPASPIAPRLL